MNEILLVIYVLLSATFLGICVYNAWIILAGLFYKKKVNIEFGGKDNRFCAVICARNEEGVIGDLIDSLQRQDYPPEKCDIYVVADNCTDATADVASRNGAHVLVRNDTVRVGKGYALSYFFDSIDASSYDAFCIFDADNTVDKAFLRNMNSHINNGGKIMQGMRCVSNPTESAVSSCYLLYFNFIIRLYMKSRMNQGLSCMVGGTGFAFTSDLVKNGWHTSSLTEDAEFSMQNLLQGVKVTLAEDAVFYDEQPTSFSQSLTQRRRWSVGTMQLLKTYGKRLSQLSSASSVCDDIRKSATDFLLFLLMVPASVIPLFTGVISLMLPGMFLPDLGTACIFLLVSSVASYIFNMGFAAFVALLTRESPIKLWKGILFYPIFCMSWSFISLSACLSNKCSWKPIAHKGKKPLVEKA